MRQQRREKTGAGAAGPAPAGKETLPEGDVVPLGTGERFEELVRVMDRLRSPGGCEWDRAQTHESLLRYLIEEAYEVVEAVESPKSVHSRDELVEELGDILLQVVFHTRIGQEHSGADRFDITDVIAAVTDKLVRRHPLVFPSEHAATPAAHDAPEADSGVGGAAPSTGESKASAEELSARWDAVKRAEKPGRTAVFDGIPPALPALAHAEKALSKARRHGVEPAPTPSSHAAPRAPELTEEQWGDRLLDEVRAASAQGVDAEQVLRGAVRRYIRENNRPIQPTPTGDR